ncbi:MAG: PAS domain S-box protein [bacterium]
MTKVPAVRAPKRALFLVLAALAVVVGGTLRVRYLQQEMLNRWKQTLLGGAQTTQSVVDDWYSERVADAEGLASSVALHAQAGPSRPDGPPPFSTLFAPIERRKHFIAVWIVDEDGATIQSSRPDSLRAAEIAAVRMAIANKRPTHSSIMALGPHAALLSIAAPVMVQGPFGSAPHHPAAVVLRADAVASFSPWASGRPNAALSMLATPAFDESVLISICEGETPPVCVNPIQELSADSPAALALAGVDTFGVFHSMNGGDVLAVTRFDKIMGWGVVRRVRLADAVVPLRQELLLEGAFLAVILAMSGVLAYAANRAMRVRRLHEQREENARLATIVDASTDGLISLDGKFSITMVNGAIERLLGYSKEALVGRPVFSLFASEWHAPLAASLRAFAESDGPHAPVNDTERCVARRADGLLVPVDSRVGRAMLNGAPLYVMGLRDVSERARTEMFLQGQRHALELIASGAPAVQTLAVLIAVVEGEAPAMRCAVYQLDEERPVARLVSAPSLAPGLAATTEEIFVGPKTAAVGAAIHRGESVFSADISSDPMWEESRTIFLSYGIRGGWAIPLRAADGQVIGALACYYEVGRLPTARERELARAAVHLASIALSSARDAASLRASERSFRSFVENAPAAIFRETRRGQLVSTNPAMVALLGYSNAVEVSRAADEGRLYNDVAARERLLAALKTADVVRGLEVKWRRADGSLVTVRVSARAYRDDRGETWLWEGYAEDVTPLRAAELALRSSERLAAVGQLISGVAHELNNPLSSIMHFAEDLLSDERTREDAEALGVIRDQARRSRAIVRDLLSFVRQRAANAQPMELAAVVAATVRAMRPTVEGTGVRLHLADSAESLVVLADRAGVEQIVTNLVSNAAQAAGRDGAVWVRTDRVADGLRLIVEDSGPGIPDEVLPRIFDPFFTTKPTGEGTGLGLSVTLGIVEQFGGRIGVDKRPEGNGSRFTVVLPFAEAGTGVEPVATAMPTMVAPGIPIVAEHEISTSSTPVVDIPETPKLALIIDDEPTIRAALRRYFTRRGFQVEEAADGNEGLAQLDKLGDRVNIVISDLRMPGYSGIELHDELARTRPELLRRFVFSTGDVASTEAASFVNRTPCPVLQKPFELRMLDEIIARVEAGVAAERVVT